MTESIPSCPRSRYASSRPYPCPAAPPLVPCSTCRASTWCSFPCCCPSLPRSLLILRCARHPCCCCSSWPLILRPFALLLSLPGRWPAASPPLPPSLLFPPSAASAAAAGQLLFALLISSSAPRPAASPACAAYPAAVPLRPAVLPSPSDPGPGALLPLSATQLVARGLALLSSAVAPMLLRCPQ